MLKISEHIYLKTISSQDSETLFQLMQEVYTPAYKHFWVDNGNWYVNTQYSKENLLKELSQENAAYYFILFKEEIIGNFRIIWDEKLQGLHPEKQVKLHRLYLHQKTQGKGIGRKLVSWLEQTAVKKGYAVIWLDAMDAQPQAFEFYKKQGYTYKAHLFLDFKNMYEPYRKMSQLYKLLH
jgi:GNAT superfamily N-acetyltransferase